MGDEGSSLVVHEFMPKKEGRDELLVVVFPNNKGSSLVASRNPYFMLCLAFAFHLGGIITYKKPDRFVHTLNTPSGLRRKLTAMDIGTHLLPPITDAPIRDSTQQEKNDNEKSISVDPTDSEPTAEEGSI